MLTPHELIRAYQQRAKKRFGQHFLSDPSILHAIADAASVGPGDVVLEIGPGPGTLTSILLERGATVYAVEIDTDAADFLEKTFGERDDFQLVREDALKVDLGAMLGAHARWKCVANLPYNVGTAIFFELTEHTSRFERMALMFQREVAQRMVATPEQRAAYGVLALMTQLHHDASIALTLPPGAFSPPPKVHSAVVALTPLATSRIQDDEVRRIFIKVVKAGFQRRRKTLSNGLKSLGLTREETHEALCAAGIDERARPEVVTFEQFAALAAHIDANQ